MIRKRNIAEKPNPFPAFLSNRSWHNRFRRGVSPKTVSQANGSGKDRNASAYYLLSVCAIHFPPIKVQGSDVLKVEI